MPDRLLNAGWLLVVFFLTGCMAQRVLYRPTAVERKLLDDPPLDLSVVVVHWDSGTVRHLNPSAYGSNAAKLLQGSHAFRQVTYDPTRATAADLRAESARDYCNTAIIPLFTLLTLGVIPTIFTDTDCNGVIFRKPGAPRGSDSVVVGVKYQGKAVMGWVALPLGLFPGWSWRGGQDQSGYREAFRLAIIARKAELARLAGH